MDEADVFKERDTHSRDVKLYESIVARPVHELDRKRAHETPLAIYANVPRMLVNFE
jgi:hypothetical protein